MAFTIIVLNHTTIVDNIPDYMHEDEVKHSWLIDLIGLRCVQMVNGHAIIITQKDIETCTLTQKYESEYGNILIMRCELHNREVLELRFKNYGKYKLLNSDIQFLSITGQQQLTRTDDWWYDIKYQWDYITPKIKN